MTERSDSSRPARCRELALALLFLSVFAVTRAASAQLPEEEGPIQDNSFLIEEAYNQEDGVVQHINTYTRVSDGGEWGYSFTQEWPAPSLKHQLSYTVPWLGGGDGTGSDVGDVAINYRYQLTGDGAAPVAFAPRLSLLLPTGSVDEGWGSGAAGLQLNLPLSTVLSRRWVAHWNAGATLIPSAENAAGAEADTLSYNLGQSFIWQPTSTLNFMLETLWESSESVTAGGGTETEDSFVLSPGLRWAHNLPSGLQIVPGIAVPIGVGPSEGEEAFFLYISFEHPFRN